MRQWPLALLLLSFITFPLLAQTLPENASIYYRFMPGEPGLGIEYKVNSDGHRFVLEVTRNFMHKHKVVQNSYVLSKEEFRNLWSIVEAGKLTEFVPQSNKESLPVMDYGVFRLELKWTMSGSHVKSNVASWNQPLVNDKELVRMVQSLHLLRLRHEDPKIKPDLSHLKVGQCFRFRVIVKGKESHLEEIKILEINKASVLYSSQKLVKCENSFKAEGKKSKNWWIFSAKEDIEKMSKPGKDFHMGDITLQVKCTRQGLGSWKLEIDHSYRKGKPTFPPTVRSLNGNEKRELISIE